MSRCPLFSLFLGVGCRYHHATSVTASCSLNTWTVSGSTAAFEAAFAACDAVSDGCLAGDTLQERARSGRRYLTELLGRTLALVGTPPSPTHTHTFT